MKQDIPDLISELPDDSPIHEALRMHAEENDGDSEAIETTRNSVNTSLKMFSVPLDRTQPATPLRKYAGIRQELPRYLFYEQMSNGENAYDADEIHDLLRGDDRKSWIFAYKRDTANDRDTESPLHWTSRFFPTFKALYQDFRNGPIVGPSRDGITLMGLKMIEENERNQPVGYRITESRGKALRLLTLGTNTTYNDEGIQETILADLVYKSANRHRTTLEIDRDRSALYSYSTLLSTLDTLFTKQAKNDSETYLANLRKVQKCIFAVPNAPFPTRIKSMIEEAITSGDNGSDEQWQAMAHMINILRTIHVALKEAGVSPAALNDHSDSESLGTTVSEVEENLAIHLRPLLPTVENIPTQNSGTLYAAVQNNVVQGYIDIGPGERDDVMVLNRLKILDETPESRTSLVMHALDTIRDANKKTLWLPQWDAKERKNGKAA